MTKIFKFFITPLCYLAISLTVSPSQAQDISISDPHLYAVEKNGTVSFILGTIHFGVDIKEFPDFVTQALTRQSIFASEALESKKENIKSDNSSKLSTTILMLFEYRGMTEQDVNSFRPETLCMAYLYWDYLDKDSTNGEVLDGQFERIALNQNKELLELDIDKQNVDEAIGQLFPECNLPQTFSVYPPLEVSRLLNEVLAPRANEYKLEGERGLENKTVDSSTLSRNHAWVPLLEGMHEKGFFAVVGAAHLDPYHNEGLLSLLKGKGFKITRVRNAEIFQKIISTY